MAQKSSVIRGLGRIDTHHHFLSAAMPQRQKPKPIPGDKILNADVSTLPRGPKDHLKYMDENSIQTAVLSMTADRATDTWPASKLVELCRNVWADQLKFVESNPLRFGSFVMAPLPCVDEALQFIKEVNSSAIPPDGYNVSTCYGQKYLGDELFEPFWAALDKLNATVMVHPTHNMIPPELNVPMYVLEFTFDTARCLLSLVIAGVFTRYPNIKFIFSHNGGTYPYVAHRTTLIDSLIKDKNQGKNMKEIMASSNIFFDTALADPAQFRIVQEIGLPVEHITYGSDFPYTWLGGSDTYLMGSEAPARSEALSTEDWEVKIARENSLNIFPRLKGLFSEHFPIENKL